MMMSMKNVLILGASSDLAQALADQFAAKSFDLILAARNSKRLEPVKSDLSIRFRAKVSLLEFDVMEHESHVSFYNQINPKPDFVICAFGYVGEHKSAMENWEESNRILVTNFSGAVSILNIVANDFERRKTGMIVGISSVAGERGRQSNYMYGSAKAGFTTYLSGLRNRLYKSNVHVLTVKPGFMQTKMLKLPTPGFLTVGPDKAAMIIISAITKKRNVVYVYPIWQWIMLFIRNIPEAIFKRMSL